MKINNTNIDDIKKFVENLNHNKFFSNNNKKYLKKDLIRKKIKSYRNFKNTKQIKKTSI